MFRDRPLDYSIEGFRGKFQVRVREADGQEHVRAFDTHLAARAYVQELRSRPAAPGHERRR